MQTEPIEIPVSAIDKASKPLAEVNKVLGNTEKAGGNAAKGTQKAAMSFTELNSAVGLAKQGFAALKQVYDFAKEGANIEFTATKFDRLAASIGTTGDVLLDKMVVATKGTLSNMEAMAAATDILSLGLAKTEEDAIRLATVQAGLAMDTNQLVLALTNQTTMRFDQLGVSVAGFDEKVKALEATGLSAQDAFTEAFLQQAEQQLKLVGNAADEGAGQFKIFEANVKNAFDELKKGTAEALLPAITNTNKHTDAVKQINDALKEGLVTQEEHDRLLRSMARGGRDNSEVIAELENITGDATRAQEEHNAALEQAEKDFYLVRDASKELQMEYGKQVSLINSMQSAEDTYTEKSKDLAEERLEAEAELKELRDKGYSESSEKIQDQIDKIQEIIDKEAELEEDRKRQAQEFIDGILEQNLARDGWTKEEFEAYAAHKEATGAWSADVVASAKAAWEEANKITAAINAIPTSKTVEIKVLTNSVNVQSGSTAYQSYLQGEKPYANGGSFVVPPQYGNEGFSMGGIATASAGETVTISGAGRSSNNGMMSDYEMQRFADILTRAVSSAVQKIGRK